MSTSNIVTVAGKQFAGGSREHVEAVVADQVARRDSLVKRFDAKIKADAAALVDVFKSRGRRLDANGSLFLGRELLFVKADIERTIYETIRAREFVPIDTSVPKWAKAYAIRRMNWTGKARKGTRMSDDAPRVDANMSEEQGKLAYHEASYGYDIDELEASVVTGMPLTRELAIVCAEVIATSLDETMRVGDASLGLTGFFNNPFVNVLTLTNGEWLSATVDDILEDLNEIEQTLITQSRDTVSTTPGAVKITLPSAYEGHLATKLVDTNSGITIKQHFEAKSRLRATVDRWFALDSAVGSDVAATDPPQGIVHKQNPSSLYCSMPVPYAENTPKMVGNVWVIDAYAKCGGVEFRRPEQALYIENLD